MEADKPEKPDAKILRVSPEALKEIEKAFADYARYVLKQNLSNWAESEYIDRADAFIRWLKGEFDPGSRVRIKSGRKKIQEEIREEEKAACEKGPEGGKDAKSEK